MNADTILSRMRRFLLALSGFVFVGALVELSFSNHTRELVQWIPFVLCGLGLITIALAWRRPQRKTLLALRLSMVVVALGSLVGLYEHIQNNIGFQLEVQPGSSIVQLVSAALGGSSPLLAPGILAVAAMLAMAATYYHPALQVEASRVPLLRGNSPESSGAAAAK
jgi:hypothetical protein